MTGGPQFVLPRPGKALMAVMLGIFLLWLMFAMAINWGGASPVLFDLFTANTQLILEGQVWRLLTAPLMHSYQGISHMLFALLGLYFLTPSLEQQWGQRRLLRFLLLSALFAYGLQFLVFVLLPGVAPKLAPPMWFGAFPVVEAIAIAWALSFKGQVVRLFFVLPVSSRGLVIMVVALSVLRVIGGVSPPEGLVSPFGGMLAGWLFGGGTPSPLRRLWLRYRYQQLDRQAAREAKERKTRVQNSPFEVIKGGKSNPPKGSGGSSSNGKGPDGGWLN